MTIELGEGPEEALPTHRRRRGRLKTVAAMGAVLVVAGVIAAMAVGIGGKEKAQPPRSTLPPATAKVAKSTLTQSDHVSGKLGYGATSTLSIPSSGTDPGAGAGAGAGRLTWLPVPGALVSRGKPAYKIDNLPVPLLYGSLPLYRTLAAGVKGDDVRELEQNLTALGYTGFTADDTYNAATATAVKKWQHSLGLAETGTVAPSQVQVATGEIRVNGQKANLGASASGDVYTYTGTAPVVTVDLDVAKEQEMKTGLAVTVILPNGKSLQGTVTGVGSVATTNDGSGSNSATTTISVLVSLTDPTQAGNLDQAPVEVTLVTGEARDVLSVPVAALVALADGGYGVQVVTGSTTRYVAVQLGMFADGQVQISGDGITAGTVVGVPNG